MQFDSFTFLIFFGLALAIYNMLRGWSVRKWFLLGASYVFYAAWNPYFLLLLIGSTTLDWWIAHRIDDAQQPRVRKAWISVTLAVNLGVLALFKYNRFMLDNLASALSLIGVHYVPPRLDIVLPIGISFYTFHSLSYCIDVYRRKFKPTNDWRDYALYVAFFPQLVAGPITRFTQMRPQIEIPRSTSREGLSLGCALLILGLFEKNVLADSVFAPVADAFFNDVADSGSAVAWSGVFAFTGQIFCDFAGYSTCAIGTALAFGFQLPVNFNFPYAAVGFSDFWRRWHISLSTWLRDYLYISLGGNRRGRTRTYVNVMLTMLIGGLWHGAAWTFVIWGGLHGLYLATERAIRERFAGRPTMKASAKFFYGLVTLFFIVIAWVWFRSPDVATATSVFATMFWPGGLARAAVFGAAQILSIGTLIAVVAIHWLMRERDLVADAQHMPRPLLGIALGILLALIILSPGDNHAFIYFQF